MTCEKLQHIVNEKVQELPDTLDKEILNELLVRIIFACHNRTHTSKLLDRNTSEDRVPDFLRKKPDLELLAKHEVVDPATGLLIEA